ncbi:hypothetical protein OG936_35305 [Streptomyces sp. NBC_00846]|uniref:hypothetical protein n=1 Tax=Streptomyces sp. NBC_00846 TaxID=2975849 RepID=UPI0038691F60|nr:hypothetical protein OG936_35305 [Streptomyces sp. NBC_00846]
MTVKAVKVPQKEIALNIDRITQIGRQVHGMCPGFDAEAFVRDVMSDLPRLELKDRITRTSKALHAHLPVTGAEALNVLLRSLPPTPEAAGVTNDFGWHTYSPHSDFVARYLRTGEYLDQALEALARFTRYFSAEVAVRDFLHDFPDETMKAVDAGARDQDHRTRRLASEATRPLLPCAPRISLPDDVALPVLEQLCGDSSTYVRTSVANHLHDLSVTQPDLVLATLQRWKVSGLVPDKHFAFIARQALRSRLKKGWPGAYAFLGYVPDAPVELTPLVLERTELVDGDTLSFSATLTTTRAVPVHVMFVISSTTRTGKPREKVYFLLRSTGRPGEKLPLAKDHVLRSTATVELTPGAYSIALQVNGRRFPEATFRVRKA